MEDLNRLIKKIISLREDSHLPITLLAVCPNSSAVLEAAVKVASYNNMPMLFAATLNQVDFDGGYTGWTPAKFVSELKAFAQKYKWNGPLYPCLDHGGPWLKDLHTLNHLSLDETMNSVKQSLVSCIEAGYRLLHIDPTVDRSLGPGETLPLELVVARTLELIAFAESHISEKGFLPISYEVGTEEVHGGLVDHKRFEQFLQQLKQGLSRIHLEHAWPCFVVAQVGTALDTTFFDPEASRKLYQTLSPLGSLAKGHYTDNVEKLERYPESGMGGANVGPEFTMEEFEALKALAQKEEALCNYRKGLARSNFPNVIRQAVIDSGRWKKWLHPDEIEKSFNELSPGRQTWLVETSSRYIWTNPEVESARKRMYANLEVVYKDPHCYVVDRIVRSMDKYINAFNLFDSMSVLF